MIVLTLIVCLSGGGCRPVQIPLDDGVGLLACGIAGQQIGARWIAEHPAYTMKGFRCGPPDRAA